jgi:hypothetical protein
VLCSAISPRLQFTQADLAHQAGSQVFAGSALVIAQLIIQICTELSIIQMHGHGQPFSSMGSLLFLKIACFDAIYKKNEILPLVSGAVAPFEFVFGAP